MSALRDDLKRLTHRIARLEHATHKLAPNLEKLMAIADDLVAAVAANNAAINAAVALIQQLAVNQNGTVEDATIQAAINSLTSQDAILAAAVTAATPAPAAVVAPPANGAAPGP